MVEKVDRDAVHDAVDIVEVNDHSACRAVGLNRASNGDLKPIRMPVHSRAFS